MDNKTALLCAKISQWAYGQGSQSPEFKLLARFENKGTDTQGMFGEVNNDTFVIAFRGSEETGVADWITDLKISQQVFPYKESSNKNIKVHYGFIEAYQSVRDAVLKGAKETKLKKVICTGHSLGGALATLAALDIQFNCPDKEVSCYTYGSPKVGNRDFAESYNKRVPNTFRFVNGIDAVPQIPPIAYEHVGKELKLQSKEAGQLKNAMEDHFPYNYIKKIQDQYK